MSTHRQRVTADMVRNSLPKEVAEEHRVLFPYSYHVLGRPSFWIAARAVRLGISANAVTLAGLVVVILALVAVLWGAWRPVGYLAGALLLNLALVLDAADGHVARFESRGSRYGAMLDILVGLFYYSLLPLCLGLSLYFGRPEPWVDASPVAIPGAFWIVTGVVTAVCCLQGLAIGLHVKLLTPGGYHQRGHSQRWLLAARAVNEGEAALLAVAALTSTVGLLQIGYMLFHAAALLAAIGFNLHHLRAVDRDAAPPADRP